MRRLGLALLATTSLCTSVFVRPALSQVPSSSAPSPSSDPSSSSEPEEVDVRASGIASANGVMNTTAGGGLMAVETGAQNRSAVTRDFIAKQSPTTNAANLVRLLPGANVANSDPLGVTDRTGISVRGLDQTELGYTFEGMPAGDPTFYLADTSEWADSEDIGTVSLTQGGAAIGTPTYSAVGGLLSETLRDPAARAGGLIDTTFGSKSTNREFIRLDTGQIGQSGVKAFASYSYTSYNNWRGPGSNSRMHVDFKAVKEWGDNNRIAAVATWNRALYSPLNYLSLGQWQSYGRNYSYDGGYTPGDTRYYKLYQSRRSVVMVTLPTHFTLLRGLTADVTPYYQWMSGSVPSGSTLGQTGTYYGNVPAGPLGLPYAHAGRVTVAALANAGTYNAGVNSSLSYRIGNNLLTGGYWYSHLNRYAQSPYDLVADNGTAENLLGYYPIRSARGQVISGKNIHYLQNLNALYLSDTLSLMDDRLKLTAGFKEVMIQRYGTNNLPGTRYNVGQDSSEPLPRLQASYQINKRNQIFADVTTNFRAPASDNPYFDLLSISSGKITSTGQSNLKDEFSIAEEIGWRYDGPVRASATFFNYNFTNRQYSTNTYLNGALTSSYLNVGGQTSRGVDVEAGLKPWHHFSPYVSGQYLHATTDNNFRMGTDYLPTAGKTAIQSPEWMASVSLAYDDGTYFGNVSFNWIDSQYATFMDDESIPAHKTADVTLGYRLPSYRFARHPQIQLNLVNISDENYLSGIYSPTPNAHATRGVFGTSIAGSSPSYYLGAGFAAFVTLTTAF